MRLLALTALALVACVHGSPAGLIDQMNRLRTNDFNGKEWVLLIAGSNTYDNYRHQADICHAFQVLKAHGVPEQQIVVMMYDDIANSDDNPVKGNIINKPGGRNVYPGVPKDFIGDDVTPDNAIKILQGDPDLKAKGKKVIESTDQDHVFVYFADHGAPGLVAFPNGELDADVLNKALVGLHQAKKYKKMVLYVEACESGSMFDGLLPNNINIYATTAANPGEPSYACYYDDSRGTYLGDVYSVNWIENSDRAGSLADETLLQQYTVVQQETNTSHVMQYGDLTINQLPLSQFQGASSAQFDPVRVPITDAIPSYDVPLNRAFRQYLSATNEEKRAQHYQRYQQILSGRKFLAEQMQKLIKTISAHINVAQSHLFKNKPKITNAQCVSKLYRAFDQGCFDISRHTYTMRYLYALANVCEQIGNVQVDFVANKIFQHCSISKEIQGNQFVIV